MFSTLTMAFSTLGKSKRMVALVVVGALAAYAVYSQLLTSRLSSFRESKPGRALSEEHQTSLRLDRLAKNAAIQPTADVSSPAPHPERPFQQVTRKIIRNGSFALTVKSFEPFFAELRRQANSLGGFVA